MNRIAFNLGLSAKHGMATQLPPAEEFIPPYTATEGYPSEKFISLDTKRR